MGEIETTDIITARRRLTGPIIPFVCHAPATARRLNIEPFLALDILELFAFVYPAQFALPTPLGISEALGLPLPTSQERATESILTAAQTLLTRLAKNDDPCNNIIAVASAMSQAGWSWGPSVLSVLGITDGIDSSAARQGLRAWAHLPEWEDAPPKSSPNNNPVSSAEALLRLSELLGTKAENRQGQNDFTEACTIAFQPCNQRGEPHLVLAEAGTGVGKTLGYVAPASLWAERNDGTVWISTFTRNLQRQLDAELDRLCPTPMEKESRIVIRKGRENYLCLLNLSDAVTRLPNKSSPDTVGLGLIARWTMATRDGDMNGGDFPAWLIDLIGHHLTVDMTDTLGECIYSACDHYKKCFIERNIRRAETADIVVANHALVMVNAAIGDSEEGSRPLRYIFDEGHHLFDAADGAFSVQLSGRETADLRRWLLGSEKGHSGRKRRGRGFQERARDIITGDLHAEKIFERIIQAANALPSEGWEQRISKSAPTGPTEAFLVFVRQQVYARDKDARGPFNIETETEPPVNGLVDAAKCLSEALAYLNFLLLELSKWLETRLDNEAEDMDPPTRTRIQGLLKSIVKRCSEPLSAWQSMLNTFWGNKSDLFIDWLEVTRIRGRDADVGYFRHWLDPTKPLAEFVYEPAHGVVISSASLRDCCLGGLNDDWNDARARVGANHVKGNSSQSSHPSPFSYSEKTQVLIIGDVDRNNSEQVAAAYRELFLASGGGGLGLFTAIERLRAVYERIAAPLEAANLSLLSQHVDPLDTGTLIDIFRAEENSCLLGTDAVRDGIDVPGRSLRLIVFDRVPWPRPTILHKARKSVFGGQSYDDMLTRLRLKQAYGRLLRQQGDKGVLVILDRSLPTRILSAFPSEVKSRRIGLAEAIKTIRSFIA